MSRAAWLVLALAGCSSSQGADTTSAQAEAQSPPPATYACGDKTCSSGVEACIDSGCVGNVTYACESLETWKKAHHGQDLSSCEAFMKTGGTVDPSGDTSDVPAACDDKDGGVELGFDTCSLGCYGCPPARLERLEAA